MMNDINNENTDQKTDSDQNDQSVRADVKATDFKTTDFKTTQGEPLFSGNVTALPSADRREKLRILEALLFAASEPLDSETLARHLSEKEEIKTLLQELRHLYSTRGVNLVQVAGKWAFQTAEDLGYLLEEYKVEQKKLSRVALETLSIIAYHQPVTRAEIEDIRGVSTSKGTLDVLMETGWIRMRGRRRTPGRPVTYGTTDNFLENFGLESIQDLPGLMDLKGAGLLDNNLPPGFTIPRPDDSTLLTDEEDPLDDDEAAAPLLAEIEETDTGDDIDDKVDSNSDMKLNETVKDQSLS